MWYGAADGWITGGVTNATNVTSLTEPIIFENLTPGLKVVKVVKDSLPDVKDSLTGVVRYIDLHPGDNPLQIALP